ncbi:hypothetical protein NW863_02770, partial [Synechococcus sp. B60.1]
QAMGLGRELLPSISLLKPSSTGELADSSAGSSEQPASESGPSDEISDLGKIFPELDSILDDLR